jgi:preprotein translocase subunit SecD
VTGAAVSANATVAVRRNNERASTRRRVIVAAAVTFVLLVTGALVSLSPTPSGFRTPAAGAAAHTADTNATQSRPLDSLAGRSGVATRYLLGPSVITPSHHNAKPTNVTTKNGPTTVHIVFTQAGAERWDTVASANFHKDVAFIFGNHVLSDPTIEPTNSSFTTFDGKVQIIFSNLNAAQAHQFASSL